MKILIPLGQIVALNIESRNNLFKGVDNGLERLTILSVPLGYIYWFLKFKKSSKL